MANPGRSDLLSSGQGPVVALILLNLCELSTSTFLFLCADPIQTPVGPEKIFSLVKGAKSISNQIFIQIGSSIRSGCSFSVIKNFFWFVIILFISTKTVLQCIIALKTLITVKIMAAPATFDDMRNFLLNDLKTKFEGFRSKETVVNAAKEILATCRPSHDLRKDVNWVLDKLERRFHQLHDNVGVPGEPFLQDKACDVAIEVCEVVRKKFAPKVSHRDRGISQPGVLPRPNEFLSAYQKEIERCVKDPESSRDAMSVVETTMQPFMKKSVLTTKEMREIIDQTTAYFLTYQLEAVCSASAKMSQNFLLEANDDDQKEAASNVQLGKVDQKGTDFDPEKWKQEYDEAWKTGSRDNKGSLNGQICHQTLADIAAGRHIDNKKLNQMLKEATYYPGVAPIPACAKRVQTEIAFLNESTFETAEQMIDKGFNPLILIMANAYDVGGAPYEASAQEETCGRQSTYLYTLLHLTGGQWKYYKSANVKIDLRREGGIYVPVQVFRKGPKDGYAYRDHPFECAVFTSAAYNCRRGNRGYDKPSSDVSYEAGTKGKMRTMFRVAYAKGHDSLLLSAFGCGAFENDPAVIAKWYGEVLNEDEFKGVFKNVTFGIIDIGKTNNLEIFKSQFPSNSSCALQ